MKAQTYHPFTVGRQARKGGGGGSVPAGLVEQVAENTQAIEELDSKVDNLIKQAVLKVTDATFVYNDPSQDPGLHARSQNIQGRALKVMFEGFYKEVEGVEQSVWAPITFKAPGGSMIGEVNGDYGFTLEILKQGDLSPLNEKKYPWQVLAKETYNDDYTLFRVSSYETYYRGIYNTWVEVVLNSTGTTTGSTEQSVQDLYTWEEGVYAKFTILYI